MPRVAATALVEEPTDAIPAPHAPGKTSQVNWADNEAFHFNPEAHCLSTVPSASPHPEGMQYGPARRSSRACAKMLVRAGHRCPTCFCLTSLCRCRRERVISCLCAGPGGSAARSHQGPAHISLCASQVVAFFSHFWSAPLLVSCAKMFVKNPDPTPSGWQHPHPCQWQVLHRSYSRRQRRLSRRAGASRPLPLAVAQSVFHSVCHWLHIHSPLATMNPHRPGGGPRQHSRPDGSRRRTAGELAKRAAKAAARAAAAAAGAAGGGAAKPAGPVVADAGASGPTQVPVSTAPTGELSASASASASASSATTSGPAHGACPDRMRHPPPSIAAGPKPSGDGQRAWMPTLKMKAPPPNLLQTGSAEAAPNAPPPAPPPKRSAEAATLTTEEGRGREKPVTEQALIPTAPSGEPSRLDASQLPPEPPAPRRSKRSRTQPPRPMPAADYAKTKWTQVTTLESMLRDVRETDVATMLNHFQLAGHYTSQHGPFHDLRDSLLRPQRGAVATSSGGQLDTCPWRFSPGA